MIYKKAFLDYNELKRSLQRVARSFQRVAKNCREHTKILQKLYREPAKSLLRAYRDFTKN